MRHRASPSFLARLRILGHPRAALAAVVLLVTGLVLGSVLLAFGPPDGTDTAIEEPEQPGASYDPPTPSATSSESPSGKATSADPTPSTQVSARPTQGQVSRSSDRETASASPDPTPTTSTPTREPDGATRAKASQPSVATAPQTSATTRNANNGHWVIGLSSSTDATYECSLDGGGFRPCGSTVTYDGLDEGTHTFAGRATDARGNTDPTPAELTVQIGSSGED